MISKIYIISSKHRDRGPRSGQYAFLQTGPEMWHEIDFSEARFSRELNNEIRKAGGEYSATHNIEVHRKVITNYISVIFEKQYTYSHYKLLEILKSSSEFTLVFLLDGDYYYIENMVITKGKCTDRIKFEIKKSIDLSKSICTGEKLLIDENETLNLIK